MQKIFTQSSWNSVNFTYSWVGNFDKVSQWLDQNCGFLLDLFLTDPIYGMSILCKINPKNPGCGGSSGGKNGNGGKGKGKGKGNGGGNGSGNGSH